MSRRSKALRYYRRSRMRPGAGRHVLSLLKILLLFFFLHLAVTGLLLSSIKIDNTTMEPTLLRGERILGSPLPYGIQLPFVSLKIPGFSGPNRGDIVVIQSQRLEEAPLYRRLLDPPVRFFSLQRISLLRNPGRPWATDLQVRRIIGIPGDTVRMEDSAYLIRPEGRSQYIHEKDLIQRRYDIARIDLPAGWIGGYPYSGEEEPVSLGSREYFVSGDNRSASGDSREFGPVPQERIRYRLFFSYRPGFALR